MAYTAFEKMRKENFVKFGKDVGPAQPMLYGFGLEKTDLKSAALRFLHERCEELKFDATIEEWEKKSGIYQGTSLKANQIPYNMQMDINRICLEKALEQFIDSGVAEDAYDVYYCYLEIFFDHYGKSKKMVELLSEFEANGSSLLMKHRDHYSHSVYVFALGLAIYETNSNYRKAFKKFYHFSLDDRNKNEARKAANCFLEYWGLTSLFHDIGYPFELPFEQVMSYFEVDQKKRKNVSLYIAYHNLDILTKISDEAKACFKELYHREFASTCELLAFDITAKLGKTYGFSYKNMLSVISRKPASPNDFNYFMDHAFFSACRLYQELTASVGAGKINKMHVDALSAIMLHNSLFKFNVAVGDYKKPLCMEQHPLAFLLMLCDELQCWDRTAYGRNSRKELHPMAVDFDFSRNAISACYYYDSAELDKINEFKKEYRKWEDDGEKGEAPRLKAYSDMAEKEQRFTADIEKIVNTENIPLHIRPGIRKTDRRSKHIFLSSSNFLHLYDFAVSLHGRNKPDKSVEELEKQFDALSLEYQLSTLNRAKHFSRYLDAINCFYTDKPVDYEMVTEFNAEQAAIFAPMEHERWLREHQMHGWIFGEDYEYVPLGAANKEEDRKLRQNLREQMRCHKLMMDGELSPERVRDHYLSLPEADQDKDWKPFNAMLKLLKRFDGLRIYKLDDRFSK